MDKALYEQAKENVVKHHEKEFKKEIKEELEKLRYESKKLGVTKELAQEIKALEKKIWSFPCHRWLEDHFLGGMCAELREMLETGRYHPKKLDELREFAIEREKEEEKRKKRCLTRK